MPVPDFEVKARWRERELGNPKNAGKCMPARVAKILAIPGGLAAILGFLAILAAPSEARVTTEKLGQQSQASGSSSEPHSYLLASAEVANVIHNCITSMPSWPYD